MIAKEDKDKILTKWLFKHSFKYFNNKLIQ